MNYRPALAALHEVLDPDVYLEIGVHAGETLRFAPRQAIAIDPSFRPLRPELRDRPGFQFFEEKSDAFFENHRREDVLGDARVDFAFIDGLHESNQVARDFANVERWSHRDTVVVFHDCWPPNPRMAYRRVDVAPGFTGAAGDCWRIMPFLRRHRPELVMLMLDALPTGLLMVTGLNPDAPDITRFIGEIDRAVAVPREEQDLALFRFVASETAVSTERFLAALGWTPPPPVPG